MVVCPVGFVADHLEVLYDLDVELAGVAAERGLAYARTASLNDDPAFVAVLADVITAADGGALTWRRDGSSSSAVVSAAWPPPGS